MNMRMRKLVGAVVLIVFLTVYALLAMVTAIALQVHASRLVEVIYYVIAGLAWTIPAGAIIWWMQRPDRSSAGSDGPHA